MPKKILTNLYKALREANEVPDYFIIPERQAKAWLQSLGQSPKQIDKIMQSWKEPNAHKALPSPSKKRTRKAR